MDLAAGRNVEMFAVKPGHVYQGWDAGGGGNWSRLVCDDGEMFGYGHADHYAAGPYGRHVEAGDVIAYVDSTGASTGDHLHFAFQPAGWGRYGDPFDDLMQCAAAGRYAGVEHPTPVDPGPDNQHPEHTPEEILVMHRYWKIDGEDTYYAVGLEPFLSPDAVGADGTPQNAMHYVGGVYVYQDFSLDTFALVAGQTTLPEILTPGVAGHDGIIAALRNLPRIYQAG
jgi:murein DD-endopeptidase MepM/ murein hydrolase activator NlpD